MGGSMAKKNWADLSTGQRIAVLIMGTIQMGLLVAALWDLAHRTPEEIRGDRRMWAGIVFINWFGPLAYFTIGRRDSPLLNKFRCEAEDVSDLSAVDEEPAPI
jgi:hypothetical protein